MADSTYDVIVIGGGPGGSSAATFLARAGKRTLLLEKEKFPRFHIGESLLPYNRRIFDEMGVLPKLEQAGFFPKVGAQFHTGSGSKKTGFVFRQGIYTAETQAYQVERSRFDHLLLDHAAEAGAVVRQETTVTGFEESGAGVRIQARDASGATPSFEASFLIDASGRNNFTGNVQGLREMHPRLKKLSIFGHFRGVKLDEGEKAGDTVIVRLANKWFWIIPLAREKVSVGIVMDAAEFKALGKPPAELFNEIVASSAVMKMRMEKAELIGVIHTASDFSYHNKRLVGPRLLRVGDAAGFMDPIFSSGVYLAMYSGKLAAEALIDTWDAPGRRARRFAGYEKKVRKGMEFYWEMVEKFYTTPFMELFLEPREKWNLASAVNAVLAGELEGGWPMQWRLRLFFWLIRLQAKVPLVPRIAEF